MAVCLRCADGDDTNGERTELGSCGLPPNELLAGVALFVLLGFLHSFWVILPVFLLLKVILLPFTSFVYTIRCRGQFIA